MPVVSYLRVAQFSHFISHIPIRICIEFQVYRVYKDCISGYKGFIGTVSYTSSTYTGNPYTYNGYTCTWEKGRQLKSMIKSGNSLAFEYNANGIRTKKTVNEIFHNYYLEGAKIHLETIKNDTNIKTLQYLYDDNDDVSGINYRGDTYYFVKNLQGDVIKLIDINGDCVVKYTYNAWGKICKITNGYNVTISDTDTTHIANINPFRYRGYYYDVETKLYYLQSRYYDPETCRFINADEVDFISSSELNINLFIYCGNNPINYSDIFGTNPVWAVGIIAGIVWGVLPRLFWDIIRGKFSSWKDYLCDAVGGAISGLITALTGNSTLSSFIGTFSSEMLRFILNYDFSKANTVSIIKELISVFVKAFIAALASIIAGKILGKLSKKNFSSKQIKNFFKNTKKISSALGIGKNGKTARRIWIIDSGISTLLNEIIKMIFGQ